MLAAVAIPVTLFDVRADGVEHCSFVDMADFNGSRGSGHPGLGGGEADDRLLSVETIGDESYKKII